MVVFLKWCLFIASSGQSLSFLSVSIVSLLPSSGRCPDVPIAGNHAHDVELLIATSPGADHIRFALAELVHKAVLVNCDDVHTVSALTR